MNNSLTPGDLSMNDITRRKFSNNAMKISIPPNDAKNQRSIMDD